jgi:hypothetical protein
MGGRKKERKEERKTEGKKEIPLAMAKLVPFPTCQCDTHFTITNNGDCKLHSLLMVLPSPANICWFVMCI